MLAPSPPFESQVIFESHLRHSVSVVPHQCVLVMQVLKSYEQQPLPLTLVEEGRGAFTGEATGEIAGGLTGAATGALTTIGAFTGVATGGGGGDELPSNTATMKNRTQKS